MIPVLDMHCDTISRIHDLRLTGKKTELRENDLNISLQKMKKGNMISQNFALFTYLASWRKSKDLYDTVDLSKYFKTPLEYAVSLSDTLDEEIKKNSDMIKPALSYQDIVDNMENGFLSGVKTVEEGAVYQGEVQKLKEFYDRGVRMTTITWNYENELGFPNHIDAETGKVTPDTIHGLKPAGKEIVDACVNLGIIVDISHLNDAGIYDVFDVVNERTPIVASHSNARSVTDHPRNLTDEMLRKLADNGGITGINYCHNFINDRHDGITLIEDMVRHIKYIRNIAGIDSIGLGSDFDGISSKVEFSDCGGIQMLAEALRKEDFAESEIEKIFYKNALRVYREILR